MLLGCVLPLLRWFSPFLKFLLFPTLWALYLFKSLYLAKIVVLIIFFGEYEGRSLFLVFLQI